MIATRDGHSCFLGRGTLAIFIDYIGLQSTPIKDNSEGPVDDILLNESYHTRSVKPLKRCIVGGQLLSIERMHSR